MKLISEKFPPIIIGDKISAEEILIFSSFFDEQIEETARVPFFNNLMWDVFKDPFCKKIRK